MTGRNSRLATALPLPLFPVLALLLCTLLWPSGRVLALDRARYSMEVLVEGVPLEEHLSRGTTYVEALEGREYSIRLTNRTGERVAVALSVDGLNTVDAKTTTPERATKWILEPWGSITLDGWQTSGSTARRFFFTTEKDSYGAWLGKTKNLGVIAAAVFRERRPTPAPILHGESRRVPAEGPRPRADAEGAPAEPSPKAAAAGRLSDDLAATGIGREVDHEVRRVHLEIDGSPAGRLTLRYEYRDALVRLGVLPRCRPSCEDALARRERARGFEEGDFAPDPYRRGR